MVVIGFGAEATEGNRSRPSLVLHRVHILKRPRSRHRARRNRIHAHVARTQLSGQGGVIATTAPLIEE